LARTAKEKFTRCTAADQRANAAQTMSVAVDVIATVRILNACDLRRVILNLEICLHDLDVHEFTLLGIAAIGANKVKGEITIMGFDEAVHGAQHASILMPLATSRI
jgi:hypothetical protein